VLAAVTVVTFLLMLDDTAVSVALPSIQRQLGMGIAGAEWAANAYTLAVAAVTLSAARVADGLGPRPVFAAGLAVFAAGSLGAGLAAESAWLLVFRAVQGIGAGILAPASLAAIAHAFPEPRRGAALGVWAGASASALGLGPLVGALVTETLGWNWVFLLNVPLSLLALAVVSVVLEPARAPAGVGRFDLTGALLSAAGPLALLLALGRGNALGWLAPQELALFAAAAGCLAWFVVHERRSERPLLDLGMFRSPRFTGANAVTLLSTAVMCSLFFFLTLYLQRIQGYTALGAGAALLPLTLTIVALSPVAGKAADRVGGRWLVTAGMALLGASLLALSTLGPGTGPLLLGAELVLAGAGVALGRTPTATAALGTAHASAYGAAAGVFSTFQATGLALGIAVMGAVVGAFGGEAGLVPGFSTALAINAGIAFATAVLAALTLRPAGTVQGPVPLGEGEPDTSHDQPAEGT
jgi:EmrB/QacA subfamily drug resistance transporter